MILILVIYEQYQREFPIFVPTPTPLVTQNASMDHTIWLYQRRLNRGSGGTSRDNNIFIPGSVSFQEAQRIPGFFLEQLHILIKDKRFMIWINLMENR